MSKYDKTKNKRFRSEAEKKAIARWYAQKKIDASISDTSKKVIFPSTFPFWARLKISKNRPTLVIDEELITDKKTKKIEEGFVHREAIHPNADGSNVKGFEQIVPNPDPLDSDKMYLKPPRKKPKRLFRPMNRFFDIPLSLKERYDKNNDKNKK